MLIRGVYRILSIHNTKKDYKLYFNMKDYNYFFIKNHLGLKKNKFVLCI